MAAARHGREERRRSLLSICIWLAALVVSTEGDCDPPKQLANASIKDEVPDATYAIGSTVTYVCNKTQGYVQTPGMSDTIKCLDDSTWSEIQEFCQRSCKLPTRFDFAEVLDRYINQNVFPVGTNVTYKCRPGYVVLRRNGNTITCLDTLEWSTVPEFCQGKDCGDPGELMDGGVKYEFDDKGEVNTKFGSVATFFCNPGFNMLGRNKRTCTASGWNNAVPICEAVICQEPPDIVDGTHSSAGLEEFEYQQTVTYSCNKPLTLIGEASIHCTRYGNWSGPAPECKAVRCTNPDITNAIRISGFGTSHIYRDSITFKCLDGFVMNGSNSIQCGADNEWHPPVPTCIASVVTCSVPPRILNAEHRTQPPFHVGTSVTYHCKSANFKLHGEPTIRCQNDGTWSSPTPECIAERCEIPTIPHGTFSEHSNNEILEITCDSLYTLHGESEIQCGEDQQWKPAVPECHLSSIFIACIILLVFLVILAFFILCYCYNKKKQGTYPTNEQKVNGPEAIHLRDESQNMNA